jgi:hypothetical protein
MLTMFKMLINTELINEGLVEVEAYLDSLFRKMMMLFLIRVCPGFIVFSPNLNKT